MYVWILCERSKSMHTNSRHAKLNFPTIQITTQSLHKPIKYYLLAWNFIYFFVIYSYLLNIIIIYNIHYALNRVVSNNFHDFNIEVIKIYKKKSEYLGETV